MAIAHPLTVAIVALAFLPLSSGALAATDPPAEADHEAAIRAAVMDYFEGGNAGDADRVASAFQTDVGDMVVRRTDEAGRDTVTAMNLGDFASRFGRPIPFDREGEIQEIRIVDDSMAFAHFSFTTPDRQYDDFFVLYLINDEWKIVTKTFTVEAVQE